jgi:oligoendopeptidase F
MLDQRVGRAETFLLDIPMRFEFERAFYEERAGGELSPERLCELMAETQRRVYGDTLAEDELDPWFWASKLHYYITGVSFYNFPYTFGYLFSLGVYARAMAEGEAFRPRWVGLLRATGQGPAEKVARDALGVDLESPGFWRETLAIIAGDLERFEREFG